MTSLTFVEEWETEKDLENFIRPDSFSVLMGAVRVLGEKADIKYNLLPDAERVRTEELEN